MLKYRMSKILDHIEIENGWNFKIIQKVCLKGTNSHHVLRANDTTLGAKKEKKH